MTRSRICFTMLSLVLVGLLVEVRIPAQEPSGKPVRVETIITEFMGPPPTLTQMIHSADAVVYGRVIRADPADRPESPVAQNRIRVLTGYTLKVSEILHALGGRPIDPERIQILREGGDRDKGGYIERTMQQGFPEFVIGSEYVVFLRWHQGYLGWVPAFGPDSVYQLANGRVDSPGRRKETAQHKGKTSQGFLQEIRQYGK